jgi:hypothetical protein
MLEYQQLLNMNDYILDCAIDTQNKIQNVHLHDANVPAKYTKIHIIDVYVVIHHLTNTKR